MHRNPNISATAIVLSFFSCQFLLTIKFRIILTMLVGLAVVVTVSRGGVVVWLLSTCLSYYLGLFGKPNYRINLTFTISLSLLILLLLTGQVPTIIYAFGLDAYISEYSIAKLAGGFFAQGDASSSLRMALTISALDLFLENILTGAGIGKAHFLGLYSDMGSHNMLLKQGVELGIFGVINFIALLLVPDKQSKYCFCFAVLYLASAMFNDTSINFAFYAVLLPFGLTMLPKIRG